MICYCYLIARAQEFEEDEATSGVAIGNVDGSTSSLKEKEGKPNRRPKPEKGKPKAKAKAQAEAKAGEEDEAEIPTAPVSSDWREFLLSGENMDNKLDMRRAKVRCTRANKAATQKVAKGEKHPEGR